jgi:O-methyltransferase
MSLNVIATKFETDKNSSYHNYTKLYQKYFEPIRFNNLKVLEIGVLLGSSMRTWLEYFPNAQLIGLDIDPGCWKSDNNRCQIVIGDQENREFLTNFARTYGPFDIIIDDGGHSMLGQQLSAEVLFPALNSGGIYVIEDLHSCFMTGPRFGTDKYPSTFTYLAERVQDLQLNGKNQNQVFYADKSNHLKTMNPSPILNFWEQDLSYVHHYRSIVFMGKNTADDTPNTTDRQNYLDNMAKTVLDYYYIPISLQSGSKFSDYDLEHGTTWPDRAVSMIGLRAMRNIQECLEKVIIDNVEGDVLEAGVWKGGASIFMRAILRSYNQKRKLYVCDSFEGLPPPDPKYAADVGDMHHTVRYLAVDLPAVKANFKRFGMEDSLNIFVKGWFKDTLPNLTEIKSLALLRLDGDMYGSTIETLDSLYHKVSKNGFIIVDDYGLTGCKRAIDDFRRIHNITEPMVMVTDTQKMYWRKSS